LNHIISATVLLALLCVSTAAAPAKRTPASQAISVETNPTITESTAGLQAQLGAILRAARDKHSQQFESLVSDLKIPDSANWFKSRFGDDAGAKLAAAYEEFWETYQARVSVIFRNERGGNKANVLATELSASSSGPAIILTALRDAKAPLNVYTADVKRKGHGESVLPGVYVYAGGAFRIINWATLYKLPGARPMRIRLTPNAAVASLVYQLNPTPPTDQHLQGTVILHILIDVDGNVSQIEAVSGPRELVEAATDAVRQWRYRPTMLNGDPVEVDTTVAVSFAYGG
jgi:TonB family protein